MSDKRDRARGALLGLAVGDALGAPFEFKTRDTFKCTGMVAGGTFGLKAGQWTDDTSMALCLAESLLEYPEFNPYDCMTRFARWRDEGYNSSTGHCFDIGTGTNHAIDNFLRADEQTRRTRTAWGLKDSDGNGCIMRIAPLPILWRESISTVALLAIKQCALTHDGISASNASIIMAMDIADYIAGRKTLRDLAVNHIVQLPRAKLDTKGMAGNTLNAAIWAVGNTNNFKDAVLAAVNLGEDSDTTGAVAGQLAGALYGASSIPSEWFVQDWQRIMLLADLLFDRGANQS